MAKRKARNPDAASAFVGLYQDKALGHLAGAHLLLAERGDERARLLGNVVGALMSPQLTEAELGRLSKIADGVLLRAPVRWAHEAMGEPPGDEPDEETAIAQWVVRVSEKDGSAGVRLDFPSNGPRWWRAEILRRDVDILRAARWESGETVGRWTDAQILRHLVDRIVFFFPELWAVAKAKLSNKPIDAQQQAPKDPEGVVRLALRLAGMPAAPVRAIFNYQDERAKKEERKRTRLSKGLRGRQMHRS
jgi:hypothetical protein